MTDKLALHTRLEKDLTEDWQAILDILAEFMQVPVALILQADNQQVNVYARNQSKRNPFRLKQNLPSGSSLFHKKVIETVTFIIHSRKGLKTKKKYEKVRKVHFSTKKGCFTPVTNSKWRLGSEKLEN